MKIDPERLTPRQRQQRMNIRSFMLLWTRAELLKEREYRQQRNEGEIFLICVPPTTGLTLRFR